MDLNALKASQKLAEALGIEINETEEGSPHVEGVTLRTHRVNLTKRRVEVVKDPGKAHISEAIGIKEYLADDKFIILIQKALKNLKEGGVYIFGNMTEGGEGKEAQQNGTRAFSGFLENPIGWGQHLKQRSIPQTLDLLLSIEIEEGSGIYLDPEDIQVYYRPGAVYPIYVITKRMGNKTQRHDQQQHQYQNGNHMNIYEGMIGK